MFKNKSDKSIMNQTIYTASVTDRDGNPADIRYTIVRSRRRTCAVSINAAAEVVLRLPYSASDGFAERLVRDKSDWILRHVTDQRIRAACRPISALTQKEREAKIRQISAEMMPLLRSYIAQYEPLLPKRHMQIRKVVIRNQKTRWGSCSSRGTLSFNWRLYLAPREAMEYVVVHELCHTVYMNHQAQFWILVAQLMPDYRTWLTWLRENGITLDI